MEIVTLENDYLKILIAPEFGAKIVKLWDKKSDYQWLWIDETRKIGDRKFGDAYDAHDISGFDDCFPNIGVSQYPLKRELRLPDHGDLWTQRSSWTRTETSCTTSIEGVTFDYTFSRGLYLEGNAVQIKYEVLNKGNEDFFAFWSAHPLFSAVDGMKIEIQGRPSMRKEFGFSKRMGTDGADGYEGHLDSYMWPETKGSDGKVHDLSYIDTSTGLTDKVVLESPLDGVVRLLNPKFGCAVTFELDRLKVPFVGICYNLNAWPFVGAKGCWLAIEPTQGATDRLDESMNLGAALKFPKGEIVSFEFRMNFEEIR